MLLGDVVGQRELFKMSELNERELATRERAEASLRHAAMLCAALTRRSSPPRSMFTS